MLQIVHSSRFKKDFRQYLRSGKFDLDQFHRVVNELASNNPLPAQHKDHSLKGPLKTFRECHITPDLLLIYSKDLENLTLFLFRMGSHAELF